MDYNNNNNNIREMINLIYNNLEINIEKKKIKKVVKYYVKRISEFDFKREEDILKNFNLFVGNIIDIIAKKATKYIINYYQKERDMFRNLDYAFDFHIKTLDQSCQTISLYPDVVLFNKIKNCSVCVDFKVRLTCKISNLVLNTQKKQIETYIKHLKLSLPYGFIIKYEFDKICLHVICYKNYHSYSNLLVTYNRKDDIMIRHFADHDKYEEIFPILYKKTFYKTLMESFENFIYVEKIMEFAFLNL